MSNAPNRPTEPPDLGALSELAPQLAQTFVSIASDIALVIDDDGVIRNVAQGAEPLTGGAAHWVGRHWVDTVTGETRRKVEMMLSEARAGRVTQRREVNHHADGGTEIPVAYSAVRLGAKGPVLAVGRDLRSVAAIQQRFVEAQQALERDYWRRRQAEARYRMLFQVATDGVLVIDAHSYAMVEANRAAAELFGRVMAHWAGQSVLASISSVSRAAVEELFVTARTSGRPGEIRALLAPGEGLAVAPVPADLSATPFSADGTLLLLVRVRVAEVAAEPGSASLRLASFVDRTPDAVVITDSQARVLMSNSAFDLLCQDAAAVPGMPMPSAGQSLTQLLGDAKGSLPAILAQARHLGIVDQQQCTVGCHESVAIDVEVSAALLAEGDQECMGLTLRRIDHRQGAMPPQVRQLASAIDRLAAQVGLMSLGDLLRETSELAERHLLEEAIARHPSDLAQAAALLGIALDDLWARMRHHRLEAGKTPGPGLLN
ncbi:transcriptional regulator PpsR [Ideonella sp. 4Y16]|uniref:Transcriptional regulator PpsR n=1 Tax=Ideonella alba TaxID=2824118 RepID=A0A940Y7N2_9BURK|nr:transcriptional regulator PpsR [Ideonella alba]MBQ0930313.1 transcriptional regulator PpsR [Ideonella alba]MBQ0943375.1 transcriptional regulator PpsR [Ideonella alba]